MKATTCTWRAALAALALGLAIASLRAQNSEPGDQGVRFKSGVELINVTATVSDSTGRFVSGLRQEDFLVYEDNTPVDILQFSAERVPVSLGIVIDTSGSMAGSKMEAAREALRRFSDELLERSDELFVYRFSNYPMLVQGWTNDRRRILDALDRLMAHGGTAMYDAVSDAIPLTKEARNRKRALVIISDGNDTISHLTVRDVREQIRQSEMLVYAVGIDGEGEPVVRGPVRPLPPIPMPIPLPFPGSRPRGGWGTPPVFGSPSRGRSDDHVNVAALREMTDDSGGRTEVVRDPRDLDPATASIADELSKQYDLAYTSPGQKDGRWHSIRVEVKNHAYRVRSRRGYIAS
jgi:VWFA-related protein